MNERTNEHTDSLLTIKDERKHENEELRDIFFLCLYTRISWLHSNFHRLFPLTHACSSKDSNEGRRSGFCARQR